MARSKNNNNNKNPFITVSSPSHLLFNCLASQSNSLLFSPRKNPRTSHQYHKLSSPPNTYLFLLFLLVLCTFFGISKVGLIPISQNPLGCSSFMIPSTSAYDLSPSFSSTYPPFLLKSVSSLALADEDIPRLSKSVMVPLPAHGVTGNVTEEEREFWKQPDGQGYHPCLEFGIEYRKRSTKISKEKKRFLVVVASGGLNQQKNQIVDAVVMARILEAALVLPILQVNLVWGDESKFSDIFDADHFKRTLQADVRVVSSLPSTHLISIQSVETRILHDVSPQWIRAKFFKKLDEEGVLVLKGLDSKLSKNLPPDLQKLRCKVAFHALRFVAPIRELGNKLTTRMWIEGPYIAIHLRVEKDVWVRTGCRTGLGPEFDRVIAEEQKTRPEFLTGRLNMSYDQRRRAGLCPLNALEVARLLKALGAPRSSRVYYAGGKPFGGNKALQPLIAEFPYLVTKEMLAREGELAPYVNKSSALAALDYIVSLSSDVFMPSHGGNMGRTMQGHRAYVGHRKYITPNKRTMLPFFEDTKLSDAEFSRIIRHLHREMQGRPQLRNNKRARDVIAYPVPECMCNH